MLGLLDYIVCPPEGALQPPCWQHVLVAPQIQQNGHKRVNKLLQMTNVREICLYSMFLKEKYIARYIGILSFTSLNIGIGMIIQALVHSSLFCQFSRKIILNWIPVSPKCIVQKNQMQL